MKTGCKDVQVQYCCVRGSKPTASPCQREIALAEAEREIWECQFVIMAIMYNSVQTFEPFQERKSTFFKQHVELIIYKIVKKNQ